MAKDEAFLRKRLADPKFKGAAASSFKSLESAEKYLSRALIIGRPDIETWAARAGIGKSNYFSYDLGETVGYGVLRATNMMTNMTKLGFWLEKVADGSKVYFVITYFPAL